MKNEFDLIKFLLWNKYAGITASIVAAFLFFSFFVGTNKDSSWVVVQYPWGEVKIVDSPGWYLRCGSNYWVYPRNWQVEYDKEWSFKVVFNDGGSSVMSAMVRFASPLTIEEKRRFHQLFGGNQEAVEAAVWAHLSDSMKSSGPVMSASEHQSSRRGEFTSLVQDQLQCGLFEMKRVSKALQDQFDDKGKPITVYATEVVFDDNGQFKVNRHSPLLGFGIVVTQFSITDVVYDDQTQRQFSQKKEAFLAAEGSKAQREKEVQERLMVEERGRRQKAEEESKAFMVKAKAVIDAQRQKEVEETDAARKVAVSLLTKQEAETSALQKLEVARLEKETAKERAEAEIILAEAKRKSLELAGAISERDRILAEIDRDRQIGIAEHLSRIQVPNVVFNGANGDMSGESSLINMAILKSMGILK